MSCRMLFSILKGMATTCFEHSRESVYKYHFGYYLPLRRSDKISSAMEKSRIQKTILGYLLQTQTICYLIYGLTWKMGTSGTAFQDEDVIGHRVKLQTYNPCGKTCRCEVSSVRPCEGIYDMVLYRNR
jgi:hypothetical protein